MRKFLDSDRRAFTLIEVLAAMAVLSLLLVMTFQMVSQTNLAVGAAGDERAALATGSAALDRIEADLSTAMRDRGLALVARDASAGGGTDSAIGFLSLSRPEAEAASTTQPRGALIAYGMRAISATSGGTAFSYTGLERWLGRFDYADQPGPAFEELTAQDAAAGEWTALGSGIVRFWVSYVLDDGTIVQQPPIYRVESSTTGNPTPFLDGRAMATNWNAVATSPETAATAGPQPGPFVRSLLVAVAVVNPGTLAQAADANRLNEVRSDLGNPDAGETPLEVWEAGVGDVGFAPLRQNLRFFQRSVSLD